MKTKIRLTKSIKPTLMLVFILALGGSAFPQTFTVSGTVTNQGAIPQDSVQVFLFTDGGDPIGIPLTITNGLGQYSISGLPDERYQFKFVPVSNLLKLLSKLVTDVDVLNNLTLDVTLNSGHLVSGFIRDTTGVGIPGIDLKVTDDNDNTVDTPHDNSAGNGFYAIVLATGNYTIKYRPVMGEPYLAVELRDVPISGDTTINVTLGIPVIISGTVLGPGAIPVVNADLDAHDSNTGVKVETPGDNTDFSGAFSFQVPIGVYDINVEPLFGDGLLSAIVLNV
ncbi:MAG: carboxypeptidase regulatory-like domain-containing protein, partial [candidate division Zixibacteria bacterium]|nr:carboxypeptidase regulatory-like domain-containing protein [candidate division Zixibacteria bacterium]